MNKINKKNILIPFAFLILSILGFYFYKTYDTTKSITSYSAFIKYVDNGKISEVDLNNDASIKFKFKDGRTSYTVNPRSTTLKESLLLKGVAVKESDSSPLDLLPVLLFFCVFGCGLYFILKTRGSRNSLFKLSSMDAAVEEYPNVSFESVAGNTEVKNSLIELVDFIKVPEKYTQYDARIPRGMILYGPPGTGKTLLAKALAAEAGVPFYAVSGSDFVQVYVGVGASRIRELFRKAREKGKAVLFIDEIDAIGKKRVGTGFGDGGSDERDQTLNALLSEMSGFHENNGIVVIAATNRLEVLDEALLRPGRFDRHLEVSLPDVNARHEILKLHSRNKPLEAGTNLYKLAQMTVYFSGAMLEHLMNEAAILAARNSAPAITEAELDKAYSTVLAGAEKTDRSYITEQDRKNTAYHEAGHAITSKLLCPENLVSRVTIIPSTKGAGGYTINIPPDRLFKTRTHLMDEIRIALGGRAAEELVFGKENISTGASGDLNQATRIVLSMGMSFGMLENTGLISYDVLNSLHMASAKDIIPSCNELLKTLYDEVLMLLTNNRHKLEALSSLLLAKETIDHDDLCNLLESKLMD